MGIFCVMETDRKRAALHNLGCKVNAYETEAMQQMLTEAGYEIVPFSEPADVYVVNTCTVTNTADQKSRQMLHRAHALNPEAVVVAAGCYAQVATERIAVDPAVDLVIGNDEKSRLIPLIDQCAARKAVKTEEPQKTAKKEVPRKEEEAAGEEKNTAAFARQAFTAGEQRKEKTEDAGKPDREALVCVADLHASGRPYEALSVEHPALHTRAFVKVQDGCDQFCSYCIIPYARGRVRSRALDEVRREVETLARNGFREIVLTGIHLSSYGVDCESSLLDLIRTLHEVEGVRRIRLSSLEPGIIMEPFVRELSALPKVCPHFHLSLQSGCDAVLSRMNRRYTTDAYLEKCDLLRRFYPDPALTTDVIVGFPGETEEEFAETCAFVRQVAFYRIHVFPYSRRDGTAAARMPGQIPRRVKEARAKELARLAGEMKADYLARWDGRQVEVLFEEAVTRDGKQYFEGFTPEYIRVRVPAEENLTNRIRTVPYSAPK